MWKPVFAATAALAIAGSSIVYAQQRFGGDDGDRDAARFEHRHRHRLSPADRAAFVDARIAALKAGLELTSDQAKNWPPFEQALRDLAKLRADRIAAREAAEENPNPAANPFDRLSQRADHMSKASGALKRVAETGAPLYASLDDAQKARFKKLAHLLRPHRFMHARFAVGPGWRPGDGRDGGPWWRHHERFGQDEGWQGGPMNRTNDGSQGSSQL